MTTKTKKILDVIPLIVLIISAVYLLYTRLDGQILLHLRHIIGLVLLPVPAVLFYYRHKLGVLSLGLLLLVGLFGGLSYSPSFMIAHFGIRSDEDTLIILIYFQPIFLLWVILHLILSGRYYIGVVSKKYWQNINSDEPVKIHAED